ncbi:MAG: putative ABC transport system ATP-binding protein [Candidatus Electronema aureum]|uniref:ABC transport system ATP-binding protein n=1 Tax=Candidatus Electronema aureum TaxID=2005002 RepID=A0A521G258_9BACT|nr:MAG: putative ABC transport system ATP-binding protein [Candidatus Electronema aureum]
MTNAISISAQNLTKVYRRGTEEIFAVNNISLEIKTGEYVAFIGPSGSGKTTLINILGCLDNPTSGSLVIGGRTIFGQKKAVSERELTKVRRELFGYIFQKFYLIPTLNVLENVLLPCTFYCKDSGVEERAAELLRSLGMDKRMRHLPGQLSGGEMQRVAIARSLINRPQILLADEPTGNLDSARSHEISEVMQELNQRDGLTVILVTHNPSLAKTAHRIMELRDGMVA